MKAALEVLAAIYARLKGDVAVLHAARANLLLPVDLVHVATGTVIEVDGPEHFTSFRRTTLDLYPAGVAARLRPAEYAALCERLAPRSDRCRAGCRRRASGSAACCASAPTTTRCATSAFPAMGHPPVVRIAAEDGDGAAAYARAPRARCGRSAG